MNYGVSGNDPRSNFRTYGALGNSVTATFSNYRNGANEGANSFQSYARNANSAKTMFTNYGKSFNPGNDTFKEYGKGSKGDTMFRFKSYSADRSFKDYAKQGITFAGYSNVSSKEADISPSPSVSSLNRWVEPGRFFRESMLKRGNSMTMPDLRDKMPGRPFLPRSISSKLPFSTSHISLMRDIFHAREGSTTDHVILAAIHECERQPSRGETKQCVASAEDMIDFATSVLGRFVVLRTTESVNGSTQEVTIGEVRGINGGAVTESVSCHQSLYPYLLYYCHSVPKVRVYEADILDREGRNKINHGVAVCHVDTSAWGPGHGAFVALGHGPGEIEVCHWIFENDMTWTIAD
ncbi:hypothetical protein MLD38_039446 [Melastoma candidum]|nr:hypothetical protein MLD38_039446 [Melastoma candidum]